MLRAVLNDKQAPPLTDLVKRASDRADHLSVGGVLARSAWGAFIEAAQALNQGNFEHFAKAASEAQLSGFFEAPISK